VKVWDVVTRKEVLTLSALASHGMGVAFSPDGRRLAAADHAWAAIVFDAPRDR
jgi:hypothetical protein